MCSQLSIIHTMGDRESLRHFQIVVNFNFILATVSNSLCHPMKLYNWLETLLYRELHSQTLLSKVRTHDVTQTHDPVKR